VKIGDVSFDPDVTERRYHDTTTITAHVEFGRISPENIRVQAVSGSVDADGTIQQGDIWDLERQSTENGSGTFKGTIRFKEVGQTGVTVRVIPAHPDLIESPDVGLVVWKRV
jgi:starch phosphorylase